MYETPETTIEPTTSSSSDREADTPHGVHVPNVNKNVNVPETITTPTIDPNDDTKVEEIKIVAVTSAADDESISKIINEEPEESKTIKSINKTESEPVKASCDDRNETRVISLDTIIRKGLNEQMPMTAKDIDNIVPNAIKQQQDANLKQIEKLASEKEFALVYESSDDYQSSVDDKFEDEADANAKQPNDQKTNVETVKSKAAETTDDTDHKGVPPQLMCETVIEDKLVVATDDDEKHVESTQLNSNESNDSTDQSFDDFGSESDSTGSLQKKRKRRKSAAAESKAQGFASKKRAEDIGGTVEDADNDPGPRLNRRGKPRKSYEETDNEQVMKKHGRKIKVQRNTGPKRPVSQTFESKAH